MDSYAPSKCVEKPKGKHANRADLAIDLRASAVRLAGSREALLVTGQPSQVTSAMGHAIDLMLSAADALSGKF